MLGISNEHKLGARSQERESTVGAEQAVEAVSEVQFCLRLGL